MAASSITNPTISLDKAKSGLKSSGPVSGSPTVVPAHCTEEIKRNLEDSKVIGVFRKQFQGKQVCEIAEGPLCKETEEPVSSNTKESVCKETETPSCSESEEPVCKRTEELLSKDFEEIVCKETGERVYKKTEEQVCQKTEEIVCKETEELVGKEKEESVIKETEETMSKVTEEILRQEIEQPVCKETEEQVCKETEEPVCKETEERIWKETEEPVCKEIEEQVCKKTEEPVCKETVEQIWKETEEPVYKEIEDSGCKETEETVRKETEEPVHKETEEPLSNEAEEPMSKQDIDYCVSKKDTLTETEITDERENDNVSSLLKDMEVRPTKFTDKMESVKYTDVSHMSRPSNIEQSESTKITGGENVSSNIPIQESESVSEQISAIKDSSNLDIEAESNHIMNSSDELVNTEADSNCIVTSSIDDNPKFEDASDCFLNQEMESFNENTIDYTAGIITDSHGAVDGTIATRACLKEQHHLEKDESVIVDRSETDETNTKNEIARDNRDINKAKSVEKKRLHVADIVAKTKVAYKVFSGFSCSPKLQVGFIFVFTLLQSIDLNSHQTEGTIVKQVYSLLNLSFSGLGEQFVFAAAYQSLFDLSDFGLPEPNLPGIDLAHIWSYILGVNMRPVPTDISNSREHEQLGDTPPDSGVFSARHNHTEVNRCPETHPLQGSPEQNRTDFISIHSSPLTVTIRGANESMLAQTHTRIEDVPELEAPSRGQLCLTSDQTDLKARRVEENLTNIGQTAFFQDGNPTTIGNRRPEVETAGSHVQEDNSISRMASQLSTSVSSQPSRFSGDSSAIAQQERMTESDVQARANTFDSRWCHSHLKPDKMAEAGFVYTGKGDATRCFKCNIVLIQWEKDDDPLVEHIRNSPECEYIQNQLLDNPQNFGASNTNGAAQENNAVFDEQNGAYGSVLEEGVHETRFRYARHVQQNGRIRLEIENTNAANEQIQSTQNCASQKPLKCDTQRKQYPHGEQGNNHLDRNHSETSGELSCERYSQQAESSGIQETGSVPSLHLQELNYRTLRGDQDRHDAGPYMHEFHDPSSSTTVATDQQLVIYHLDSEEVRMVHSEGYSWTDMTSVVEAILKADGVISVDRLRHELRYIGARPRV